MKRILNKCIYLKDKLLCFMWECQFTELIWFRFFRNGPGHYIAHYDICKHCGAHKHD